MDLKDNKIVYFNSCPTEIILAEMLTKPSNNICGDRSLSFYKKTKNHINLG